LKPKLIIDGQKSLPYCNHENGKLTVSILRIKPK
jgi:hypothetical protein